MWQYQFFKQYLLIVFGCLICVSLTIQAQILPSQYAVGIPINYVRTWEALSPQTDPVLLMGKPFKEVRQNTQYLDGLGRPLQLVIKQGALNSVGSYVDLVQVSQYDDLGREPYRFLPFATNSADGTTGLSDGNFKGKNPFLQQRHFYSDANSSSPIKGQGETFYYSMTDFEASPLNRSLKTSAPGNNWIGSSRGIEVRYWTNTDIDNVQVWSVENADLPGQFAKYKSLGKYNANELSKTVTKDEHGKQVIEFEDKEGQVILKKVQLSASEDLGAGSEHWGWLCTYYIYDDLNQLRAVVPPKATNWLRSNLWNLDDSYMLTEGIYRYEYDKRGRLIVKKLPGAGEVWMVYDNRDRVVMTQDANLRSTSKKQWRYAKYDDLNRPSSTGLFTDPTNFNNLNYHLSAASASYEYPNLSGYTSEELTHNFYDDYSWKSDPQWTNPLPSGFDVGYNSKLLAASNDFPFPQLPTQATSATIGMLTGTRVRKIQKTGIVGNDYMFSVFYYDEKMRLIQSQAQNSVGGIDINTTQYSWNGTPLVKAEKQQTILAPQTHVLVTKMEYDDLWRLVTLKKNIESTLQGATGTVSLNSGEKIIARYEYDALGRLTVKHLGTKSGTTGEPLETQHFDYNIQGWTLGMNRSFLKDAAEGGEQNSFFGYELGYDKDGYKPNINKQYNGNIGLQVWKSKGDGKQRSYDYTYDEANRLTKGSFLQKKGTAWNLGIMLP